MSIKIERVLVLFKAHWPALVLALALGILTVAPQFAFMHSGAYRGIEMLGPDAEEHYVARIQEVNDGYPALGNVFLGEKQQPYLAPGLGENIVARLGHTLGMSAAAVNILSKFFFPALLTLLAYAFSYALFASRRIALLGAAAALIGDSLMSGPGVWLRLLEGSTTSANFLTLARPINPEISELFFFGGLLIFYQAFIAKPRALWWEVALLGLVTGLAVYVSPYPFTFLGGLMLLSFGWFAIRRDWPRALGIFASGTLALLCAIPFALNYVALTANAEYPALALRQGLVYSHAPLISLWLILMLLAGVFAWPRTYPKARVLYLLATLTLIILTDQQVLTGVSVVPSHYHWYLTKPLVGILGALYAWILLEWATQSERLRTIGIGVIIAILFYNGIVIQLHSYTAQHPAAVATQAYAPALEYLNTLPSGQGVWADPTLSQAISIYTTHDAPNNFYALYYLVSNHFLVQRMLLTYRLQGVPGSEILPDLKRDRADVSGDIFGIYYREQWGGYANIPDSLLEEYAQVYKAQLARPESEIFHDLGVSHVVWDTSVEPLWHMEKVSGAREVFSSGSIHIYALAAN